MILVDSSTHPEASSITIPEIFQKAPNARVISLSLRENGIDIYDKQHVVASGPAGPAQGDPPGQRVGVEVEGPGAISNRTLGGNEDVRTGDTTLAGGARGRADLGHVPH